MTRGIFLLLGTNQGDRIANLALSRKMIALLPSTSIVKNSSIYKTEPWGNSDQPEFYNQVIGLDTELLPETLLKSVLGIEREMGRIREVKWGPRIIDIDLLLYNQQVIESELLAVPHPGIPVRRFTLVPLAEIAPGFIHPGANKTIIELLDECPDQLEVSPVI